MEKNWNQWLAGLIDGEGSLLINKKGYMSCEITLGLKDEHALNQIKNKLGGSIKLRSGSKSIRYRLHHKEGIINLITRINGEIRNTIRIAQLINLCSHLNIPYRTPEKLTNTNSWISGMFDAEGSVTMNTNEKTPEIMIKISNKYKINLIDIKEILRGNIFFDKSSNTNYWSPISKVDISIFLEYIKTNPVRTVKKQRLFLIPEFYRLKEMKAYEKISSLQYKTWLNFQEKWSDSI